ncbi:hypothetical protein Tco_0125379, partial [Tanacetum coccineum]
YGSGSETPMHPSRTSLHPYMTPMRDSGATPIMPMRDRAWNPYTPMSPPRDSWEDGNPGSWGSSPQYQCTRGVLVQKHIKHQLLVQDGPILLVGVIVKLAHRGTTPLPMVT